MLYSKNGGFCGTITFFGPPHVSEGYFFSSGVTNHDSFSTEGKLEQGKRERRRNREGNERNTKLRAICKKD